MVESQPSKLLVASSILVSRSIFQQVRTAFNYWFCHRHRRITRKFTHPMVRNTKTNLHLLHGYNPAHRLLRLSGCKQQERRIALNKPLSDGHIENLLHVHRR